MKSEDINEFEFSRMLMKSEDINWKIVPQKYL